MQKKIRAIGALVLVALWALLIGFAWFSPANATSEAERRPLKQWPAFSAEALLNGKFMTDFESYTLDQFPLRDSFRQIKSLFHYYVWNQSDNNNIYIVDGYAAKMEYPLMDSSVALASMRLQEIYDHYLAGTQCKPYLTIIPDKGYYLAEQNGYLSMDYDKLFATMQEKLPWATYVDITDCLDIGDYYRTDTHWRQEQILPVAQKLSSALGVTAPQEKDFTVQQVTRPFYGVYYGQAALPMDPEPMYLMRSPLLEKCTVMSHDNKPSKIYNMGMMQSKDLYDIYLSGMQLVQVINNPSAKTDKELIVFRDSFGSSLVPLLIQDYKTITVVDTRYIAPHLISQYVTFTDQDVLFAYSTLVLNSASALQPGIWPK